MYYARLKRVFSGYLCGRWNDAYLNGLAYAFVDSALRVARLKEELGVPGSTGIGGNYVDIDFEGDTVLIGSQHDESDDDKISISRDKLLKLIDEWQELIKSNPDEIILHRDDAYYIWFEPIYFDKKL